MRMANKTNVNANKEAETVEEVKAVDDAPVTEGTDVKVNEEETVPADKKEEVEAAKPKPVSKGNRRGSKALQLELEKAKELAAGNEEKYKRLLAEFENMRQRNEKESKKMYDIGAKFWRSCFRLLTTWNVHFPVFRKRIWTGHLNRVSIKSTGSSWYHLRDLA